jgi:hypothetical protein
MNQLFGLQHRNRVGSAVHKENSEDAAKRNKQGDIYKRYIF